ncbi:TrmO family methyltransferase [Thermococcus sp.]|uniref:TrmO family methyltransferase domain-containing protein n=1 Tax=Thermococcus sp. TaxID=35749 RepID=UPI00344E39D0
MTGSNSSSGSTRATRPQGEKSSRCTPTGTRRTGLTGVFATRSPYRPNPVALYTVRIHRIKEGRLYIDEIDAEDGTPVVDIKIFVERYDCPQGGADRGAGSRDKSRKNDWRGKPNPEESRPPGRA